MNDKDKVMSDTAFREDTTPLLSQEQVRDLEDEIRNIEGIVNGPIHVQQPVQDMKNLRRQYNAVKEQLAKLKPRPYRRDQLDDAIARHDELMDRIKEGMPTPAEMRRMPPGSLEKHMNWEDRNKTAVLEWKNIRKRLHVGGDVPGTGRHAYNISNVERLRPKGGSQELDLSVTKIKAKSFYGTDTARAGNPVFTDHDIEALRDSGNPDVADELALLSAEERQLIKDYLVQIRAPKPLEQLPWPELKARVRALGMPIKGMTRENAIQLIREAEARAKHQDAA